MIHFISSYGKNVSVGFAPLHVTILNKALFVSLFSLLRKSNTNLKSTYHLDIVVTSSNGMCASLNTMSNFAEKKKYISKLHTKTDNIMALSILREG